MKKYEYEKIIQGNFAGYWEDVSAYPAKSDGCSIDSAMVKHDLQEYRASSQGIYRVIFRRSKVNS